MHVSLEISLRTGINNLVQRLLKDRFEDVGCALLVLVMVLVNGLNRAIIFESKKETKQ